MTEWNRETVTDRQHLRQESTEKINVKRSTLSQLDAISALAQIRQSHIALVIGAVLAAVSRGLGPLIGTADTVVSLLSALSAHKT